MPPARNKEQSTEAWWQKENAYELLDRIAVLYELPFGKDVIKPGNLIRIKNMRGTYRFRCVATNIPLELTWVDCMNSETGSWHSFRVEKIKGLVKPKKSRRKKDA